MKKLSRKDFLEEEKCIRRLRKEGKPEHYIKSWIRGWRQVTSKKEKENESSND